MSHDKLFVELGVPDVLVIPDEEVIERQIAKIAKHYAQLRATPGKHVNGSLPISVLRASVIQPGASFVVGFFQVKKSAEIRQILEFLDERENLHLGVLGNMLLGRTLPAGVDFLSFEESNTNYISLMTHTPEDRYRFGFLRAGPALFVGRSYGFVLVLPYPGW